MRLIRRAGNLESFSPRWPEVLLRDRVTSSDCDTEGKPYGGSRTGAGSATSAERQTRQTPLLLREDFSGTGMVSMKWICSHPGVRVRVCCGWVCVSECVYVSMAFLPFVLACACVDNAWWCRT